MIPHCLRACEEAGHVANQDVNDGDPLGVSVAQFNVDHGVRVSSASAFLRLHDNLSIVTGAMASRLVCRGRRVVAVELLRTKQQESAQSVVVHASEEIILTAGSFQSAQLLLLSGIGPANHLSSLGIPVVQNLPAVGANLQDLSALACEFVIKPEISGQN